MKYRETSLKKLLALVDSPFYADLLHIVIVLAEHHLLNELLWEVNGKGLRKYGELSLCCERLQAWQYLCVDASLYAVVTELDDSVSIIAYLSCDILSTCIYFLLEITEVCELVRRLYMLLWVTSHTDTEVGVVHSVWLAVDKLAVVHLHNLLDKGISMLVTFCMSTETHIAMHSITTKGKDVIDTEEVKVDKGILNIIARLSTADNVWHNLDTVFLLDGSTYAYGTRTTTNDMLLDKSVRSLCVFHFLTVAGNVDEGRIKWHERVDSAINLFHTVTFKWRKQLEREA